MLKLLKNEQLAIAQIFTVVVNGQMWKDNIVSHLVTLMVSFIMVDTYGAYSA